MNSKYQSTYADGQIILTKNGEKINSIPLDDFNFPRNVADRPQCSDTFLHLAEKDVDYGNEFFFDLAAIVFKNLPDNRINWVNTLCATEGIRYGNHQYKAKGNEDSMNEFEDIEAQLEEDSDIRSEVLSYGIQQSIMEMVTEKLKERGLI